MNGILCRIIQGPQARSEEKFDLIPQRGAFVFITLLKAGIFKPFQNPVCNTIFSEPSQPRFNTS